MANQATKRARSHAAPPRSAGLIDIEPLKQKLREAPRDAIVALALAEALARANMKDNAARAFEYVLSIDPNSIEAHLGLGGLRLASGYHEGALVTFSHAQCLDPASAAARHGLAEAFDALGFAHAARLYRTNDKRGTAGEPNALLECAQGYLRAGLHDKATMALDQIAPPTADDPAVLCIRANILVAQDNRDAAIDLYRRAVGAAPDLAEAWGHLGAALAVQGALEEAETALRRALALRPNHRDAGKNLANVLMEAQRHDEALAILRATIAKWPGHPELHSNLANLLLLLGRFEEGWDTYEWRRRMPKGEPPLLGLPEWHGEALDGRPLHVMGEQGPGDAIMFASCVNELQTLNGPLHLYVEPRLVPLLARAFPFATVGAKLPEHPEGLAVPLGSLPRLYRRSTESFKRNRSFLLADPAATMHWRERFAALGGTLRVGLSWRGGKDPVNQRLRTTQLEDWLSILTLPGVVAIDLQYGAHDDELDRVRAAHGIELHRFETEIDPKNQLDGLAAQLAALDLLVSIDNSTLHLAGALGTPSLALLPYRPSFRWQLGREDCLWYPSVRLIRQVRGEPWGAVARRAATIVEALLAMRTDDPTRQSLPGQAGRDPADSATFLVNAARPQNCPSGPGSSTSLVTDTHGTDLAP